jgi:DNA-directed RNA polymerase specialized sigma24 family protein
MTVSNEILSEYLVLIKKITSKKVNSPEHYNLREDVAQETFLKLYRRDYFNNNDLHDETQKNLIASYIAHTVKSCFLDHLQTMGLSRRLTKSERELSEGRYKNIITEVVEDVCESDTSLHSSESPEQHLFVKEAYGWIKSCFEGLIEQINDKSRKSFFETAFWQFEQFDMPMKMLAGHVGYSSSNPTQEFNRFTKKVSLCTQPHGIEVVAPHGQIQFLREQIAVSGDE